MNLETRQSQSLSALTELETALLLNTGEAELAAAVVEKVDIWTNRQPFLTQLLCQEVMASVTKIEKKRDPGIVDTIARRKIVKNWENGAAAAHLKQIQAELLAYDKRDSLLILYLQVLQKNDIRYSNNPEKALLLRTGIISETKSGLAVSNAVYANVFDESWIERQLPGITRPVTVIQGPMPTAARRQISSPQMDRGDRTFSRPASRSAKGVLAICALLTCGAVALLVGVFFQRANQPTDNASVTNSRLVPTTADSVPAEAMTQVTLLGDTFSGYSTFRNAEFQSVLRTSGIDINYTDEFDQTLRSQKLSQGKADLMVTTLDQFLRHQPQGKIIGLLDRTVGADAVVLNTKQYSELKSLLDLEALVQRSQAQGKKLSIAYASDTPSEYLALVLDTQFDTFNLSEFELKPVADASEAWALMQAPDENVAIAVLWEPYVTQARQQGYSVVLSSKDAPNVIVDVMVASDRLIQSNPEIISQLLEKYYRRIDANIRDATQLQTQVAEDGDLAVEDAAAIINGIDFFTATEARDWFNNGTLSKRIDSTAALLILANRLETMPADTASLYARQFVTEAANNTQALIDLIRADNPKLAEKLAGNLPAVTALPSAASQSAAQTADIGNFQVRGQVSFATDSADLTEEGKQTLNQLASELKEFNKETIAARVIGHTSRSGNADLNLALSQRRATVVANYLKGQDVEMNIQSEGKGFSEPLPEVTPNDARNQRTEIRLVRVN
ncbi:MAG: phosphate ABC transporter substrate-binding/OmpA family protein [Phormidesmis sp.]